MEVIKKEKPKAHTTFEPSYILWIIDILYTFNIGLKWQTRRKLLTYTFHFKILETYIPTFNKHAQCLTKKLENMASNNQRVSIYTYMTLCALDIVCGEFKTLKYKK